MHAFTADPEYLRELPKEGSRVEKLLRGSGVGEIARHDQMKPLRIVIECFEVALELSFQVSDERFDPFASDEAMHLELARRARARPKVNVGKMNQNRKFRSDATVPGTFQHGEHRRL